MSNLHILNTELTVSPIESRLRRMRDLADQIKVMEAEYAMLKEGVISDHFMLAEEYRTDKGLLLASYKGQEQISFQQSKFKADHNDIYQMYCEKKVIFKFLLK